MSFDGPAPQIINGRLAMLGFVAALGAELATGTPVLRQLATEPTLIILASLTFIAASLAPLLQVRVCVLLFGCHVDLFACHV